MRASTAFNNILSIPGASVTSVEEEAGCVVVRLRLRARKHTCSCGARTKAAYDRSTRRWRHLDLGGRKCFLEATICRVDCRSCGAVRTETVPFARPGCRLTRDLQDVICYLAQRCDKKTICALFRVSHETVARVVSSYVSEQLDPSRLEGLARIGVDEISYRKGQQYLTVVADHDRKGAVVYVTEGKSTKSFASFYDELGPERAGNLEAVSLDMGAAYKKATDERAPKASQCVDPFHVVKLANEAIDKARRATWQQLRVKDDGRQRRRGRPKKGEEKPKSPAARSTKHTRWALLKDPGKLSDDQKTVLDELRLQRSVLYRCWQLKESLRDLYKLDDPSQAEDHLKRWLAWACRSRIPAFVALARTIRANRQRILNAVELGLSNSKLEGLNSKIRLINHRGYGHRSLESLKSMIYLCCGGVVVELPYR